MRARFAPLVLIAVIALAACDGSGSGGDPSAPAVSAGPVSSGSVPSGPVPSGSVTVTHSGPPQPAQPTVPADVPTTGPNLRKPGERPPVMPLEATQHTQDGAVAFAKFFIQTIDWGFATTSGAYMRHYYEKSCVECASHADSLDATRKAGQRYVGSRFTVRRASPVVSDGRDGAEFAAQITFDITSMEVLDRNSRFINADIARSGTHRQVWIAWRANQWTVVDMRDAR